MLGAGWTQVVALAAAFAVAVAATPAGVSGAVLLLPFQVSVLGTPSPAVTPTNLLYNVVATPGALYRYWRQGQASRRLALVLIAGTPPGVVAGSVIRVEFLPGPRLFALVAGVALVPLGAWLALTRPPQGQRPGSPSGTGVEPGRLAGSPSGTDAEPGPLPGSTNGTGVGPSTEIRKAGWLVLLSFVVGCAGGIYGIGGGSVLAPVLIGTGRPPAEVAPAALASTFVTSVAGVLTFALLAFHHAGPVAPDWPTGIALGIGGLAGGYTGARVQARLPDLLLRRLIALIVLAIGVRYLIIGLT
jgi:uncharacterized protein